MHRYIFVLQCVCVCLFVFLSAVSGLRPEEMPEVRMDTEDRQTGYEVHHQKLVLPLSLPLFPTHTFPLTKMHVYCVYVLITTPC